MLVSVSHTLKSYSSSTDLLKGNYNKIVYGRISNNLLGIKLMIILGG